MRSGAAIGHPRFFHETALFASDDELLSIVVQFLEDGRAAGEPTFVSFGEQQAGLVRDALGDADAVTFLDSSDQYLRPAAAIRSFSERFAGLVAQGAGQIRVVGDVPHPGVGVAWDAWARYESTINHAFEAFPVWGLCPYDTRVTPDEVLEDVMRTHQHVATADGGHHGNDRYVEPRTFLGGRSAAALDPLQHLASVLDIPNPSAREARRAVAALDTDLGADVLDDLVMAVSEIVTNASRYGTPPVRVQGWAGAGRVVVTVHDEGFGVDDPFAGLLPPAGDAWRGRPGALDRPPDLQRRVDDPERRRLHRPAHRRRSSRRFLKSASTACPFGARGTNAGVMQTFLPHPDFAEAARSLDTKRLGKQRVEALQILRALTWAKYGWKSHPAVLMWEGYEEALVAYALAMCEEWGARGHADTVATTVVDDLRAATGITEVRRQRELAAAGALPPWLGDEEVHRSHRSALVRKDPEHYRERFPDDLDDVAYVWPVRSPAVLAREARQAERRRSAG